MTYEGYDRQNTGFVVCMWLLALLALFGVEIRHCLYLDGRLDMAVLYAVGFTAIAFSVRRWLIWRELHRPGVWIAGRRHQTSLRDAHPQLRAYVTERADRLGVDSVIDVKILPRTFNLVDGYIVGDQDDYTMVLTAGAAALFLVPERQRGDRFRALVDHELGHVAAGDVHMLYLARAIWWALLVGGPIKLVLMFLAGWSEPLEAFRLMLPRLAVGAELADVTVVAVLALYWSVALGVLDSFYRLIVQRREFMADAFAYKHGGDEGARKPIEDLLKGRTMAHSPPQAFGSGGRWHPKVHERLEELGNNRVVGVPHGVAAVLVFTTLLSTRLVLGRSVMTPDVPYVTRPLSALFVLVFGYVLSCMVFPIRESNAASAWPWKNLLRMLLWSGLFSCALSVVYAGILAYTEVHAVAGPLMSIEALEQQCMVWSVPLCILFFGVGMMFVMHRLKAGHGEVQAHFAAVVFGSSLGIGMLFLAGKGSEVLLEPHREATIARSSSEVRTPPGIAAMPRENVFLPPFSFFALWHGVLHAKSQ